MNELVNIIVKKTKISPAMAQIIVNLVLDYLKKKLPAPIAAQVTGILGASEAVSTAQNVLGGLLPKKKK
jgi:nucleoid DNA-binding protein